MSRLADAVEELEVWNSNQRHTIEAQAREISGLREEVETLRYDIQAMLKYIEWFEAAYPEAKIAYEVAQRVS